MTEELKTRLHQTLEDMNDIEDECLDPFNVIKMPDRTAKENNVE